MTKKLRLTQGDLKKAHAEARNQDREQQKIAEMDGAREDGAGHKGVER